MEKGRQEGGSPREERERRREEGLIIDELKEMVENSTMQCNTFSAGEAAAVPLPVESGFFQTSDQASLNCLRH
jgi:hypothetical protein